jgi:hypothetical protein
MVAVPIAKELAGLVCPAGSVLDSFGLPVLIAMAHSKRFAHFVMAILDIFVRTAMEKAR